MKQGLWIGSLLGMLLLLGSCSAEEVPEAPVEAGVPIEVQTVERGSVFAENLLSGSIGARDVEEVYVAVNARCSSVPFEVGDKVEAGDALVYLDLGVMQENISLAEQNLSYAEAEFDRNKALLDEQLAQQQESYDKTLVLFEAGLVSEAELDGAALQLESTKTSYDSTLGQLTLAVSNAGVSLSQARDSLDGVNGSNVVRAPLSGTITSLNVTEDGYTNPGSPVAVIESSGDLILYVNASESVVPKLRVGQPAEVHISALDFDTAGTITKISEAMDPQTRLYRVEMNLSEHSEALRSGMFAEVTIYTDSRDEVILVPSESILTGTDGSYVVTLDAEGYAVHQTVETGLVGGGETEIVAGLTGGETLVTLGQSYLDEGDLGRIVGGDEETA